MLKSMTAFATAQGGGAGLTWAWEMRGVNGKGLDLRLRVPDWIDGLETDLRARLGKALSRGNVTLSLKVTREETGGRLAINSAVLEDILSAMSGVEQQAMERGLSLAPATAADVVAMRGVLDTAMAETDTAALKAALVEEFAPLLQSFVAMREAEGAALGDILDGQLTEIERLVAEADKMALARQEEMKASLRAALARVLEGDAAVNEDRMMQELAQIAVKSDVTEEIDRLRAHVTAARDLVAQGSPIGRKLDFLTQEFNREANTLCSKAQNIELTNIGLALKTVIDQMREQVQNVE